MATTCANCTVKAYTMATLARPCGHDIDLPLCHRCATERDGDLAAEETPCPVCGVPSTALVFVAHCNATEATPGRVWVCVLPDHQPLTAANEVMQAHRRRHGQVQGADRHVFRVLRVLASASC